jgi:hypothetical protein
MTEADIDALKTFVGAGGTVAVLVWLVRYFQGKLDSKDTLIASMIEKQGARDVIMATTLDRIAGALDRIERRLDGDNFSGPHPRVTP